MKITKNVGLVAFLLVSMVGCKEATDEQRGAGGAFDPTQTQGSGVGNGGGVIKRDGKYITIGSTNIELEEKSIKDLKAFAVITEMLEKLPITENQKGEIERAVIPRADRKYFNISPSDLNPTKEQKLLQAYESLLGEKITQGDFALAAVTVGKETYLLPSFYELEDEISRAAILFHEALWVILGKIDLKTVIRAEVAIERMLRSSLAHDQVIYDFDLMQILKKTFKNPYLGIVASIAYDFRAGPITMKLIEKGKTVQKIKDDAVFSFTEIFSEEATVQSRTAAALDTGIVHSHFVRLKRLNPSLTLMNELLEITGTMQMYRVTEGGNYYGINSSLWPEENYGEESIDLNSPYADVTYRIEAKMYPWHEDLRIVGYRLTGGTVAKRSKAATDFLITF